MSDIISPQHHRLLAKHRDLIAQHSKGVTK